MQPAHGTVAEAAFVPPADIPDSVGEFAAILLPGRSRLVFRFGGRSEAPPLPSGGAFPFLLLRNRSAARVVSVARGAAKD